MASYNKVLLMGNLTRDIELRQLPSGASIATIGLAVNERYKDKNDQWVERANFIDCEMFGRRAEVMAQYLSKGSPVFIEGRLRLDTWQDKNDGSNRSKLKVVVENFEFVGGGQGGGGGGGGGGGRSSGPSRQPAGQQAGGYDDYAEQVSPDDIPF
ncbi:MAG: single-stranded DNA-binding protein [Phycisphaerales bacterium]|nr:single-stranded DNA-binding protein [Phycisphaerales bacterium]MCB9835478.1 single-stranded DNA-binding protein [Phycisphaera sp.]